MVAVARHREADERQVPAEHRPTRRGARSIRARLTAILAVPTLGLILLSVANVVVQGGVVSTARSTESTVRLVLATQGFVHEVQRERGLSNGLLAGETAFRGPLDQQRQRLDAARRDLDQTLSGVEPAAAGAVRDALSRLSGLNDVRAEVDTAAVDRARVLDYFTTAIQGLTAATATGQRDVSDAILLADLDTLRAVADAKEQTALERGFLNGVFATGRFTGQDYVTFSGIRGAKLAGFSAFASRATPDQQAALDAALRSEASTSARDLEQRAINGVTAADLGVDPSRWWAAMTQVVDDLRGVQQQVGADAIARAIGLRSDAVLLLALSIGLAVIAVVVAALLGVAATRSITRPLRLLAEDAREAAAVRLPAAVAHIQDGDRPPGGDSWHIGTMSELENRRDEIADVASALTEVQRTAVGLASEQARLRRNTAESMASLARRNQNLLRRQLGFITRLERDEDDADALGNLFELDHLATRMRRNAESLLVLVGETSPRRWSDPVPISDVIRAALSEVEEYRRVTVRRLDDTLVVGAAGAELAHLLAELIENSLSFSPPDRDVEVYGQMADGSSYVIAVVDHGIGMPREELERANARLVGAESFLVAPTRYLGHYVVGQLARRLGLDVELRESPLTGITARVVLSADLLAEPHPAIGVAPERTPDPAGPARPFRLGRSSGPAVAVLDAPAVTAGAPGPAVPGQAERTRNGLVKRVRAAPPAAPPPATTAAEEPVADNADSGDKGARSRTSITDLRAGFARHSQERAAGPDGAPHDGSPG